MRDRNRRKRREREGMRDRNRRKRRERERRDKR